MKFWFISKAIASATSKAFGFAGPVGKVVIGATAANVGVITTAATIRSKLNGNDEIPI